MIDGHEGCSLSARGDIRRPHVVDHRPACPPRQRLSIAKLDRQRDLGTVDDGLTMKADQIDFRRGYAFLFTE